MRKNGTVYMHFSDHEIITMLQTVDSQNNGLRQLMSKYQERLYWVIRKIVESHEDADDVLQNTFIKAYRNIGKFESRSSLFTWLYTIARNEALTIRKSTIKKATVAIPEYTASALSVSNENTEEEILRQLHSALNTLPERQKQVFEMRYYQELSYNEIGNILNLTEGALKASYHHAVKKIEHYLLSTNSH